MGLTNKHNAPRIIAAVANAENRRYVLKGDISTTRIISPPQINELTRRHAEHITTDIADVIPSLIGTGLHKLAEEAPMSGFVVREWTFFYTMAGWFISGTPDFYDNGTLDDLKVTKVWSSFHGLKQEHELQGNINAFLIRNSPYSSFMPIDRIRVIKVYKDWSLFDWRDDYPPSPIEVDVVPLWHEDDIKHYLYRRLALHHEAQFRGDDDLPYCTPDERWYDGDKFAVIKPGNKRATSVQSTMKEAKQYMTDKSLNSDYYIEVRKGTSKRCEWWCGGKPFCHQYANMTDKIEIENYDESI